ncbi:ATP-dependent helicase [Compostibacillus humi]|uniref:ATP-dependent helicase n=1 Tax=Compostibacillus humi TaxID=1245525 RepID=A0A8J3EK53_9BACI|nr:ATP-dependent DNA helicase [Compostibacillus humi]GGH70359.1 ATP-dependent helicase [Compostibacillus humi]
MTDKLPFTISREENFFQRLSEYIGDVFYDILPEKGFELRDEQIYMAFQLEKAFKQRSVMFAEAGVGTGKTIVYLLYAICYARYKGKPAIISCADETLIEQLVKKDGDLEKIERALGITVDVRLAKAREQYVCVRKLDKIIEETDDPDIIKVYDELPSFVFESGSSMQAFHRYGDRKDYPWVNNKKWDTIAWDPLQQCSTCEFRHRSAQTLQREYYRYAKDLIICSHDFFMEHIWTKESRKREGQLPLLPEASAVIFDEGHLLEFAAQKGLTYRYNLEMLNSVLSGFSSQDVREQSLILADEILFANERFFAMLEKHAEKVEGSHRKEITRTKELMDAARTLEKYVQQLLEELVFDGEMYTMDEYQLKVTEEYLEFFSYGLSIFLKEEEGIYWLEEDGENTSFVMMPQLVEDVLREKVFSLDIPFIFSSATLSENKDFSYLAASLGIEKFDAFSVDSPFDYDTQMELFGHTTGSKLEKWEKTEEALLNNGGSSLVLFSSMEEMEAFRQWALEKDWPFPVLYEGDREISGLIRTFQQDSSAVLCACHLWEGLDVPGEALTQVIIVSLPFPPDDPVFKAKRKNANNPELEIDVPYMLLRLRQGVGRLIRTKGDKGEVHLLFAEKERERYGEKIANVLPKAIKWK